MDDRNDFSVENPNIPSHILVQKQLQDLIAIQKARCSRLEEDITSQNTTLRENYVPKEQYQTELSRLQGEEQPQCVGCDTPFTVRHLLLECGDFAQESLRTDYVPKEQYDIAVKELEEEKVEHAETRIRLSEVTDKLETAMSRLQQLSKQLEQEKAAYDKAFGSLRSKNMQETSKSMKLQSKCSEIVRQCEKQEEILNAKTQEIQTLESKLRQQESLYKKEIGEVEIEKQQQRYIAKMLEEQDRKKVRGMSQAVPKTKPYRR